MSKLVEVKPMSVREVDGIFIWATRDLARGAIGPKDMVLRLALTALAWRNKMPKKAKVKMIARRKR